MDAPRLTKLVESEECRHLLQQAYPHKRFDLDRLRAAMSSTMNIGAMNCDDLVGCVRVLSDG